MSRSARSRRKDEDGLLDGQWDLIPLVLVEGGAFHENGVAIRFVLLHVNFALCWLLVLWLVGMALIPPIAIALPFVALLSSRNLLVYCSSFPLFSVSFT